MRLIFRFKEPEIRKKPTEKELKKEQKRKEKKAKKEGRDLDEEKEKRETIGNYKFLCERQFFSRIDIFSRCTVDLRPCAPDLLLANQKPKALLFWA